MNVLDKIINLIAKADLCTNKDKLKETMLFVLEQEPSLIKEVYEKLIPLLEDTRWLVSDLASNVFEEVNLYMIKTTSPNEALERITPFLHMYNVQKLIPLIFDRMTSHEALEQMIPLFLRHHTMSYCLKRNFCNIIKSDSKLPKDAYEKLVLFFTCSKDLNFNGLSFLNSIDFYFNEILKIQPSLAKDLYEKITPLLKYEHRQINSTDYKILQAIILVLADIIEIDASFASKELLEQMISFLQSDYDMIRIAARETLAKILKADPSFTKDALESILRIIKHNSNDSLIKTYAKDALPIIIKADPNIATKKLLEHILPLLKDFDHNVCEVLFSIIKNDPSVATKELLEYILPYLNNNDNGIQMSGIKMLCVILKANASLKFDMQ